MHESNRMKLSYAALLSAGVLFIVYVLTAGILLEMMDLPVRGHVVEFALLLAISGLAGASIVLRGEGGVA